MKYVGIDLGTTNSAICSFDGELVHLYKVRTSMTSLRRRFSLIGEVINMLDRGPITMPHAIPITQRRCLSG